MWSVLPPVPKGTKPLAHQVGGHIFGRANGLVKDRIGFLQNNEGSILKPVQGPVKGQREVEFYKKLFDSDCSEPELLSLRSLVPKYEGMWSANEHPNIVYLKLEDLTMNLKHPCIMDVKIGPVTYDMFADEEKIKREKNKFPPLEKIGFQLVGIKVFDPKIKDYKIYDRKFLRTLNEQSIATEGFRTFFNCGEKGSRNLIKSFLKRLEKIEMWFSTQKKYKFIASSLLFIYDGINFLSDHPSIPCDLESPVLPCKVLNPSSSDTNFDGKIDLRMIDFTHTFSSDSFDENYLFGLKSLIDYLQNVLDMCSPD